MMGPTIELTPEQAEEVIVAELEDALMHPAGVPLKVYKAIKRTYKWFSPPLRQQTFLKNLPKVID